jgi:hypothetical protein
MSLRDGWPAVSNAADQFDIRAALRVDSALDTDGNVKTGVAVTGKSLSGLVTVRSDMQVDVAAFAATLDRQGPVKLYNDGMVQVKLDAAPTANSRIDAIYVKQQETASPISDSVDGPIIGKVTGIPSTSPSAPAIPAGALRLADVTIPSTATSTSSSGVTVTQRYPYTASAGGRLTFRSEAEMNAWNATDGYTCRLIDGTEYTYKNGSWVRAGNLNVLASKAYSGWDLTAVASGRVVELRMNSNGAASTNNSGVLVGSVLAAFAPSTRVIALLQTATDGAQLRARVEPSGQIYIDHQGVSGNKDWYISGGLVYLAV